MANNIESISKVGVELDKLTTKLQEINKEILKASENARNFSSVFSKSKSPSGLNDALNKSIKNNSDLETLIKERELAEKRLIKTQAKLALATEQVSKAVIQQSFDLQQQNKLTKEAAVISSRYSTLLQKTAAQRNREARIIQDLNVKKALGNKLSDKEQRALKKSEAAFKKYDTAVRKAKESVGRFQENVGNYPKLLGSVTDLTKGLIGSFGVIEGLRLAFDFAGEAVQLAREARGVEFAFTRLGAEGVDAFERIKKSTRGLLSDLEIKRSLNEFSNFNISLEQTDILFEFLAVRAAQTGRSIDSLKDSLVEGLSKESKLRIDNLGISAAKLNDELSKTPNFVEAVANIAKEEIAEAGDILDSTANSQERFNAAFENFKVSAGSGFIGSLTNDVYELGTSLLNMLSSLNETYEVLSEKPSNDSFIGILTRSLNPLSGLSQFNKFLQNSKDLDALNAEFIDLDKNSINELNAAVDSYRDLQKTTEKDSDLFFLLEKQIKKVEKAITAYYEKAQAEYNKNKLNNEREALTVAQLREELKRLNGLKEELTINDIDRRKSIDKEIKKTEKLIDTILGVVDAEDKRTKALSLQKRILNQIKKANEEYKIEFDLGVKGNGIDLEEAEEAIKRFKDQVDKDLAQELLAAFDKQLLDEALNDMTKSIESFTGINADVLGGFINTLDDIFKNGFEDIGDIAKSTFETVGEVANSFFNGNIEGINQQIEANQAYYDNVLSNENLSDEARKKAEKDREGREKKLLERKRKEQAKQAQINKALNVFNIINNTAQGVTAALATANIPLSVLIGSLGAAQLALALATPIPKFAEGGVMDHDGLMQINDHPSGRLEVVERDGKFMMTTKKDAIVQGKKGDIIHKDASKVFENKTDEQIINNLDTYVIAANLSSNMAAIYKAENKRTINHYKLQTDRVVRAINKKKSNFVVNNSNNIDLNYLRHSNF